MRTLILVILFIWALQGCENSKNKSSHITFAAFDISYNDYSSACFSIKFTQSDTVFIKKYLQYTFSENAKSGNNYYSLLNNFDRIKIDSFLNKIAHNYYYNSRKDSLEYQFFIEKDSTEKIINVFYDESPIEIESFVLWVATLEKNLTLYPFEAKIDFKSIGTFLPPTYQK